MYVSGIHYKCGPGTSNIKENYGIVCIKRLKAVAYSGKIKFTKTRLNPKGNRFL